MLKDIAGRGSERLEIRDGASVSDLLGHYEEQIPRLGEMLPSLAVSVNQEYAGADVALKENDEIALLPPVSGGMSCGQHAAIVRERIDAQAVLVKLHRPEDGAAVVFEGVVRNNSRGRQTLFLEYEAYEEMALKQMEELALQARAQFQVRDVTMVHRLGRLEVGEISVLIVVVSPHRGPAFDACRWLIDTLKRTVPVWKKEHFADGAVWADGEPFPAEIPRPQGSPSGQPASK
jgi:MoaE-MoaD fusion protein